MTTLTIKGHVCEIGDFNVYQEKHKRDRSRGIVLEVGEREVVILGLSKKELQQLAGSFGQALNLALEFTDVTAKPGANGG